MRKPRPTVDPLPRFWAKVNKNGPVPQHIPELGKCWIWTGCKRRNGHGYFHYNRKPSTPYRFSYELHFEVQTEGLSVLHKCDNGSCVNPGHLFLGTQLDNMRDCSDKGRTVRGEKHSHSKLSSDDIKKIRKLYNSGQMAIHEIVKLYPVNRGAISKIVHRKRWAHVV